MQEKAIKSIMAGRKIGTFFTNAPTVGVTSVETLAENGTLAIFTRNKLKQARKIHSASVLNSRFLYVFFN